MNTIKTYFPDYHIATNPLLSWTTHNDCVHFMMEEPFGINQLDLIMIVRLLDNGNISTSEADILDAKAFSCSSDCEFQVDKKEAIRILKSVVLPYIWALVKLKFPQKGA